MGSISRGELAGHRRVNDCWIAVYGKVYDVTHYLDEHPGRAAYVI
jgi:cytochrome b involved in lipid metabolism